MIYRPVPTSASLNSADPFELERLAEELASRDLHDDANITNAEFSLPVAHLTHDDPLLTSDSFSVEEFLLSRPYTSLPDLRVELRDYLGVLKQELVGLINDDYEAFISLSTNLQGEDLRIKRLQRPLGSLREVVMESRMQLCETQTSVKDQLKQRASLREEKALLHLLLKVSDSITRLEAFLLIQTSTSPEYEGKNEGKSLSNHAMKDPGIKDQSKVERNQAKHLLRVATEFTQLLYHVEKARSCAFSKEVQWRIDRIKATLSSDLDHLFTTTLLQFSHLIPRTQSGSSKSDAERIKRMADLTDCLRIYDMLNTWRDAEEVVRKEIVRAFVKKTFFSGALSAPHSPILPRTPMATTSFREPATTAIAPYTPYTAFMFKQDPFSNDLESPNGSHGSSELYLLDDSDNALANLYNRTLQFIDNEVKWLMDTAERIGIKHHRDISKNIHTPPPSARVPANGETTGLNETGFDFMTGVIWPEIARGILDDLGNIIFAVGRPSEFRKNYETTQAFIRSLEFLSPSLRSVERLRQHSAFLALERRWQLPVYFQLRWKEIVGELESSFDDTALPSLAPAPVDRSAQRGRFGTAQGVAVWSAISACWSADIYIPELGHRFWKLTLQLLSRYKTWLKANVNALLERQRAAESDSSSNGPGTDKSLSQDLVLKGCTMALLDISQLKLKLPLLFNEQIASLFGESQGNEGSNKSIFDTSMESLTDLSYLIISQIVSILSQRCCDALSAVKSIPGHFRATSSKALPTTPSRFVPSILRPLKAFFGIDNIGGIGDALKDNYLRPISSQVVEEVTSKYITLLATLKKQEESLQRLKKKSKGGGFSFFGGSSTNQEEGNGEEDRISMQLALDVEAFGREAQSLGTDVRRTESFKELLELTTTKLDTPQATSST